MTTIDWSSRFADLAEQSANCHVRNFYQAGVTHADTAIADVPMVALDFETTGLDPENNEIVSIGLVPFNQQRIFCRQAQEWQVKPVDSLRQQSVVIHGIRHTDVSEAPDLLHILNEVLPALSGHLIVVHYRYIERQFMARELLRRIGEGITFPVIDTMALEQRILQDQQVWTQRLLRQPLPSLRLGDCRKRYRLPFYHPHHALTDALATAELLQAQLAHHYTPDTPVGQLWSLD